MTNIARLRNFVIRMQTLVESLTADESALLEAGSGLLAELITVDDWLPDSFALASTESYRQYLLHCDPGQRFSVVSFVWGPGQETPIHDHTVWGMVGVLRGRERCEEYGNPLRGERLTRKGEHLLECGEIDKVSPRLGDVHRVSNALTNGTSVSIHVYGANIGALKRHCYDPATGQRSSFVSGYHNTVIPNLWGPDP
jgi:predicted metal-dependent enzyme (double-stranded beta helix superfamily)